ncbi:MAG: putative peptidoglycan glycosyltransferase FtsW [Lachnospiraceae bacterium]|nr:putative peptidoglycan glycosyltransferase FtsW [Lachnospiraceae bacterium]
MKRTEHVEQDKRNMRKRKQTKIPLDYTLIMLIVILVVFGLVMIYSTSYYTATSKYGDPAHWVIRQGIFAAVGLVAMIGVSFFDYHKFWKWSLWFYIVVNVALVYVLFFGVESNGARRWIGFGSFTIQPSEIAKLMIILCYAKLLSININRLSNWRVAVVISLVMAVTVGLVGIENLSTAIILSAIIAIMLYVASSKFKSVLAVGVIAVIGGLVLLFLSGKAYRLARVTNFLDESEEVYQTQQSLYAIGSGGLLGKGLGQSLQKLGFVPEAHNDMIFSIICEELGFVGAIGVILLYLTLLKRMYKIAIEAKDVYGALIVVGSMAHIGVQVFVNLGVVTDSIPNTGVPLPFISYGGSSIVFLLIEMGVVLSVARTVPKEGS